jgi:cell division transport system permease protein
MPVSADYVVRETAANLWRNRLMTIVGILVVAISLAFVGAVLLLKQGAANAEVVWQRGVVVTVWMQPGASKAELAAVSTELGQLPYVTGCVYRDQAYDFSEAKHLLTHDEVASLTVADVPSSYRCTPSQPQDAQIVINRFSGQPGVRNVTAPNQEIHAMQGTITVLQLIFISVAVILLLGAAVLILNTIRMAIFARRREISVMKLVGATNWFIRLPFMSEGLIQGLLGSLLAAAAVVGLQALMNHFVFTFGSSTVWAAMRMTGWQVVGTDVVVIAVGVIVGSAGSALAIRRFLDV